MNGLIAIACVVFKVRLAVGRRARARRRVEGAVPGHGERGVMAVRLVVLPFLRAAASESMPEVSALLAWSSSQAAWSSFRRVLRVHRWVSGGATREKDGLRTGRGDAFMYWKGRAAPPHAHHAPRL
ncbi:hypothetical protein C8J57DRAFT_160348 [Mycena rebaudengoi]|nr:hypothetical protein C8J57DRAFT_160348 [Mycena rebaudengoi]